MSSLVFAGAYQVDEDMNLLENDIYNGTNANFTNFYQDGNLALDISDESGLDVNSADYWDSYNIASDLDNLITSHWDNITNKFITAVDGIYLYMDSTTITLNETKLNSTIESIDTTTNTSMKNYVDSQDTVFNDSIKTYVDAQDTSFNDSLKAYADAQDVTYNTSIKNYADGTFITQANEGNLDVNSSGYWDALNSPSDFSSDSISESAIDMDTSCGAGNHLYINGNNLC